MCVKGRAGLAGGHAGGLDVGCEGKGVEDDTVIKNLRRQLALPEVGKPTGGAIGG